MDYTFSHTLSVAFSLFITFYNLKDNRLLFVVMIEMLLGWERVVKIQIIQTMASKDHKPQVSIDVVKDVVKKLKSGGLSQLTHHDLAVALTTIGFREVCKEFGTEWSNVCDSQALAHLTGSDYDLSWFGKTNNPAHVPFLQLCARGDIEKAKEFLFTMGAKGKSQLTSTTDNYKRTALHLAVLEGYDVLAEYLIVNNFQVGSRDRELKTPLHYCRSELVCQLLLKRGANVVLKDNKNCTVAHYTAGGGEYRVLEMVLKKTNIVNEVDSMLKTPLHYAIFNASQDQINVLRILIQNGAKVDSQDSSGRTPLHYAAEAARNRCIPFLLQKGASTDIRDKAGKTPLDLCANDKVGRLFGAYRESQGIPSEKKEKIKRNQFSKIADPSKENRSKLGKDEETSKIKDEDSSESKSNPQVFTTDINQVTSHYGKIQEELRKQRAKNIQQYTEILRHLNEISNLKQELSRLTGGEQKTDILSKMVEQLRSKNQDLVKQINLVKVSEAAARRKCGQLFLKSLSLARNGEAGGMIEEGNLFDDDAIINLYDLLRSNPPNLEKRFKLADRRGSGRLNIEEFTKMLQELSILPQDVMSMHRITGFAQGRKNLSLVELKTILENRHKSRPMWQKKLIRKIKGIILSSGISLQQFFKIIDIDDSGTVEPSQLRKGLQDCNIFMNQTDWSNLFNLLDADKSGTIQLQQMKTLFQQESSGKLDQLEPQQPQGQAEQDKADAKEQNNVKYNENKVQQQIKQKLQQSTQKVAVEQQQPARPENDLLSDQQQQFKQEYKEQDQDQLAGITKLNGNIKVQVPVVKDLALQGNQQQVYIRFVIQQLESIKMVDLSKQKLSIAIKFQMIDYKVLQVSEWKMHVSVFKSREMVEQNYLGQFEVDLGDILAQPKQWAINNQFQLEASEFEKDVSGSIVMQVKWIPQQEE